MKARMRARLEKRRHQAREGILTVLAQQGPMSAYEVKQTLGIRMLRVYRGLDELISDGVVSDAWESGTGLRVYFVRQP